LWHSACAAVLGLVLGGAIRAGGQENVAASATSASQPASRAPYVHRLTLYDHEGVVISPDDRPARPYSPRATCAKCHDYAAISGGWHFNAWRTDVPPGRPGEPWIHWDAAAESPLLISGRGWPGTRRPDEAGLTDFQFLLHFGRNLPGGAYGEPFGERLKAAPERARWRVGGPLEIDCMFCHSADQAHDPAETARQIEAQNFRWAATVALGLAVVRGEARKAPDDWDELAPPDPDHPERSGPMLVWNRQLFDADDRVLFNITRRPPNERCYFCHTVRPVGPGALPVWLGGEDVHLRAGLRCTDCHRNGIDHMITRGYEAEARERGNPLLAAYSCAGCHLGAPGAPQTEIALGGHYRAPRPAHRGLPPVHLERLTCTACHSGPWPGSNPQRVQTSLAHGLGLSTRPPPEEAPPVICQPLFARQHDGKIAPQRAIWSPSTRDWLYFWPLAHDVRPASQSLGIRGCADCHSMEAPVYFGLIVAAGQVPRPAGPQFMYQLRGEDGRLARAWALAFQQRQAFKWLALICCAVVFIAILSMLICPARLATQAASATSAASVFSTLLAIIGLVGLAGGAATGFLGEWLSGRTEGWMLFAHMLAAPLYLSGLAGVALLRCRRETLAAFAAPGLQFWARLRPLAFLLALAAGLVCASSMLLAMWPLVPVEDQERLTELHAWSGLCLVILVIAYLACAFLGRLGRR